MTIEEAVAEVLRTVDRVGDPKQMSADDYEEFLGALTDELRIYQESARGLLGGSSTKVHLGGP